MSRRKKINRTMLTPDETREAAGRMMAAAQAHQRASSYCFGKPDAKPPNIDAFFFYAVSFELILLSVEQSLRLLLLLHDGSVLDRVDHNLRVLYRSVQQKSGGKEDFCSKIIEQMNALGKPEGFDFFSEKELRQCLNKHDSSYSNFRYFQLDKQGKLNPKWEVSARDQQIMHSIALALIGINVEEMNSRGMKIIQTMSAIPRCKMTSDQKALVEGLSL